MRKNAGIFIPEGAIFSDLIIEGTSRFLGGYLRGEDVDMNAVGFIEAQTLPFLQNARRGSLLLGTNERLAQAGAHAAVVEVPQPVRLAYEQSWLIMRLMPTLPLGITAEFQALPWAQPVQNMALAAPRSQVEFDDRVREMDTELRKILSGRTPPGSGITPEVIDKQFVRGDFSTVRTVGFFSAGTLISASQFT